MSVREILERALSRLLAIRQTHYVTAEVMQEHRALDGDIRQALAALDAEGVGLKGEIRRFADEMYDCSTVTSQAMHRVCQDLLTRWEERRRSTPLPGQSPEFSTDKEGKT